MITDKKKQSKTSQLHKKIWFRFLVFLFIIIFFSATLFINYFIKKEAEFKDKIYPNIFVDNINFGQQSKNQVLGFYRAKNNLLQTIQINIFVKDNIEATLSGELLNLRYPAQAIADRAYLIGRGEQISSKLYQKTGTLFNLTSFAINSNIEYDKQVLDQFLSGTEEKYNIPAKNALFNFDQGRVVNFRKEESGVEVDAKKFYEDFAQIIVNLKNDIQNKNISLKVNTIKPEVTLSQANNFGIEELIGEGVSDYSHSDPDRIYNLTLATSKFNGVLMLKDKEFSFDDTVGEISQLTGYKRGYIIKGGKTILDDGGGVCQVSTTFFRAALNAGLPVTERHAHAYRVIYYENDAKPGFDATIYPPSVDLKVKNDTPAYILIQTEVVPDKNLIYFRFYGKKDGRKSEISNIKLYDVTPPNEPQYKDDPVLKKGVTKQIEVAHWGAKASFDYKVIKDEKITNEQTFFSNYIPWRAVYLVGTAD